jgi:pyruvate/2-oxoglutarate dehydrogenase complex dihydrolipoamide acyltransferase (E2) component
VPWLGSSDDTHEVKVSRWLENVEDGVQEGEGLLEVETDKVTVEIEAPSACVRLEQKAQENQFAKFTAVVAIIESED